MFFAFHRGFDSCSVACPLPGTGNKGNQEVEVLEVSVFALGLVAIGLAMLPLSRAIGWYLSYREEVDWREVQELAKRKGIAVGKLAEELGRNTLSK